KAAHVLRGKGIDASTIHSLIYKPGDEDDKGNVKWIKADGLDCHGVIVDEASMVSEEIHNDLRSFGLPLIFVGDHGQLPPVQRSDGRASNLMDRPALTLQKVHRNAGEIAHFAEFIRQGNRAADWQHQPGRTGAGVRFTTLDDLNKMEFPKV